MMRLIRSARARAALSAAGILAAVASVIVPAPAQAAKVSVPAAAGSAHVTATIALGKRLPYNIATDPVTHMVYVTEPGGLIVINGRTNKIVTTIRVPARPSSGKPGPALAPGIQISMLPNVATDPQANRIYLTDSSADSVLVIDGRTNRVVATVNVRGRAYWIAANAVTHRVYVQVLNHSGNLMAVIDGQTDTVIARIPEPGVYSEGTVADPLTNMVYVTDRSVQGVLVIDGRTNQVVTTITGVYAEYMAIDPRTSTLYATWPGAEGAGTLYVISTQTNTVTGSRTVSAPTGIAADPRTNFVYAANWPSQVVVINGQTGQAAASVPAGDEPVGVATDPLANTVYVANLLSHSVTVLAGSG
jgi:YVTN family beta-propeller protein